MNARRASILLIALAVAAMGAQFLETSAKRLYPRYDEVSYLAISRDFAREGSLPAIVRCHLEGRCREDNRPPLYQIFIAPFVDDEPRAFADAKLVEHAMALLLVAVVGFIAASVFSPRVGIGSAITVSLMSFMPEYGARLMHDLLFAAVTFATVHAFARWQDRGFGLWLLAGVLIGLAFLTKGSGHLLFVPLVATAFYRHRWALVRRPVLYLAACGFLATSFFLLWRNVKVFGSPFYNFNNAFMWLDRWQDLLTLRFSPEYERVGLLWYLERHSLWEVVLSVARGAALYLGISVYAAGIGFSNQAARVVTGLAVVALAVLGLRRRWQAGARVEVIAVLSTIGVYYPALAFTAKNTNQVQLRYALPYVVLVLPYAVSEALERLWPRLRAWITGRFPRSNPAQVGVFALALLLIVRVALAAPAAFARNPRNLYEVEGRWHETSLWFSRNLAPGERFAMPYQSYYSNWDVPHPGTDARWPFLYMSPATELLGHLSQAHVRKILVDREEADHPTYRDKFSPDADAHGSLAFLGWPRCFHDSAAPSRFLVYCKPGG